MICIYCGKEVVNGALFCPSCGSKLDQVFPNDQYFYVGGSLLKIEKEMDLYNSLRKIILGAADIAIEGFRRDYQQCVHDVTTFLELVPQIYGKQLGLITKRALDLLVAQGVYDESFEQVYDLHSERFAMFGEIYDKVVQNVDEYIEQNVNRTAHFTSFIPELMGWGYGVEGVVTSLVATTAFNLARDGIETKVIEKSAKLKPAQQAEIFSQLEINSLSYFVLMDYQAFIVTLADILRQHGVKIWIPNAAQRTRTQNIYQSILNPNFPAEKRLEAFFAVFEAFPYDVQYFDDLLSLYGDTEETREIISYFGMENRKIKTAEQAIFMPRQ